MSTLSDKKTISFQDKTESEERTNGQAFNRNTNIRIDDILCLPADDKVYEENGIMSRKKRILEKLQANILNAVKHKYMLYCFLEFEGKQKDKIRDWIRKLPLTSAFAQTNDSPHRNNVDVISILLSYKGYAFFFDKKIDDYIPLSNDANIAFAQGPSKRCPDVFGNRRYVEDNYETPVDAVILIASNNKDLYKWNKEKDEEAKKDKFDGYFRAQTKFEDSDIDLQNDFKRVFYEVGLRNPKGDDGDAKEWFGFKDGISNPRFFPKPEHELKFKPDEASSLDTVLIHRNHAPSPDACGSFVAFLKLEQNVDEFNSIVEKLSKELNLEDYKGYTAAYLMGRHKDGTPLHSAYSFPSVRKQNLNDFNFHDDKKGVQCPFHAHTRKANPRDGEWKNQIARRGRVYGDKDPKSKKGILFLSYQSDLRAFEDMVNRGLYTFNYKNKVVGRDILFAKKGSYKNSYRKASGRSYSSIITIAEELVKFRGGQYFFAPSISFIKEKM